MAYCNVYLFVKPFMFIFRYSTQGFEQISIIILYPLVKLTIFKCITNHMRPDLFLPTNMNGGECRMRRLDIIALTGGTSPTILKQGVRLSECGNSCFLFAAV